MRGHGLVCRPFAWLALLLAGCAHVEPPRGGAEDNTPPSVLQASPENEAVIPAFDDPVVFEFDERITRQGVTEAVSVSPRTSPVEIRGGRSAIRVSLREGWEPGVIYHVTLLTTVRDLFGNSLAQPYRLVFSTGPAIPESHLSGSVTDRLTGTPARDTRVEAIRAADSLVYTATTDSIGAFVLDRFPAGEYQVRSFTDTDRDRALDGYEARDSTFVTITETEPASVELSLLAPDSTAPTIADATADSAGVRVTFDDHLDPEQVIGPEQVQVSPSEGGPPIPVASASVAPPAAGAVAAGADAASPPLPSQTLVIELAPDTALLPDVEYRVSVSGVRNINGIVGDDDLLFRTPAAPAPPP